MYVIKKVQLWEKTSLEEHYTAIDREKLADTISKNCTDLPNVQDVATLVTDQQVLIIYETDTKESKSNSRPSKENSYVYGSKILPCVRK